MRPCYWKIYGHLPYLRRYARALTGSTERGDELVIGCVQAAVLAPTRFGLPGPSRAPLYALLHLLFDGEQAWAGRPVASDHPVERALQRLTESDRRLYLLVALEELDPAEAAVVIGIPAGEATGRLVRARGALREALAARILLVADRADAAADLVQTIRDMGHTVCGTAADEPEATILVATRHPTLAVLDLRPAGDERGIRMARWLRGWFRLPVVYITNLSAERAQWGNEHTAPVIREPYTPEAVRSVISDAVFAVRPVQAAAHRAAPREP